MSNSRLSLRVRSASRGQALLIAVLVLFAVATLGALFTAIIGSQLAQVSRQSDVVALRNIAEAGLRLANEELTYSPLGADWRPSADPYLCGDGQVTVEVSYGPSPDRIQSRFLRILSTAIFPDNPFLRHTILALKPVLLTDYARFITDHFETNRPAGLGVTGVEVGGGERLDYISAIQGPIRSNTDLVWYGRSYLDLRTTFDTETNWRDLGILRDDRVEVSGRMRPASMSGPEDGLELAIDGDVGNLGSANLFAPATPREQEAYSIGYARMWEGAAIPNTTTILADLPGFVAASGEMLSTGLQVPRVRPPEIDAVHPDKETNRYLVLTRESGAWVQSGATGLWYNTGEFGWGWANYGGIYVDNGPYVDADGNAHLGDIQYNHDLEKLRLNWTRSVGAHQTAGDQRPAPQNDQDYPPKGPADWWDKTSRYYAPPGAEIILHGEAECPYIEIVLHDVRRDSTTDTYYYWRDPSGTPVGGLTSPSEPDAQDLPTLTWEYAPAAGMCSPSAAGQSFGIYDGNRAFFPFPPNGVIYAEGNIRIRGIMPPVRDNRGRIGTDIAVDDVYQGYFGEWAAVGGRTRRFDLQVVSGGTIYIEGDLLSPSSAHLGGLSPYGAVDDRIYYTNDSLYGSRIALLARDYVCVNTTALNPRPADLYRVVQQTVGTETVNRFYNDAQPTYTSTGAEQYLLFENTDPDQNAPAYAAVWGGEPLDKTPPLGFSYTNSRLRILALASGLADLHLILGHSGLYVEGATPGTLGLGPPPSLPPDGTTGPPDHPSVEVAVFVNDATRSTAWQWANGGSWYQFVRPSAETGSDQSDHWYTDTDITQIAWTDSTQDDWLELLPDSFQAMLLQAAGTQVLTGDDTIAFASRVSPVRYYDPETGLPTRWEIPPKDLCYLLGPVAIAPPRTADPLPVEIDALIYAQNGSWFVLPGRWFNDDPDEFDPTEPPASDYPGYHEPLNIKISVYGAISENLPADLGSVADWTSKWCGPAEQSQGFLSYVYDPLLRYPRRETRARIGYLRFPSFPITSDLVIWGERVSGAAGS
jgi:hypothetical protein